MVSIRKDQLRPGKHLVWNSLTISSEADICIPFLLFLLYGLNPQNTYICRVQSCVWRLPKYWPPTLLSTQRVCPPPHQRRVVGGYTHSPGNEGGGVGGVNILEDARHRIGLLQYNLSTDLPHLVPKSTGHAPCRVSLSASPVGSTLYLSMKFKKL